MADVPVYSHDSLAYVSTRRRLLCGAAAQYQWESLPTVLLPLWLYLPTPSHYITSTLLLASLTTPPSVTTHYRKNKAITVPVPYSYEE